MDEYHYFVAHEFTKQAMDDLRDAIERAFNRTGLRAYYADLEIRQSHILDKIVDMIFHAQFGIFDISNPMKPNVFLELGFAMAARKPYYLICKKGTDIPADLEGLDRIEYESYLDLTKKIKKYIIGPEQDRINRDKERRLLRLDKFEMSEDELIKKCIVLYEAEHMHHKFGDVVFDKDAVNQRAWLADLSEVRDHLIFGPYEALDESGNYVAFFKMKINDNSTVKPVLLCDVIGPGGSGRFIRGNDFDIPLKYNFFGIKFEYKDDRVLEYRVQNLALQSRKVWVDYIAIIKQESPRKEK